MSDKPEKKKTPMTGGAAERIGNSDTDEDFKDRAKKAADKNEKKK